MASDLALSAFAVALMCSVGAIGLCFTLFFMCQNSRNLKLLAIRQNTTHTILDNGIHLFSQMGSPFIAMPDSLKTHDEMIAWMTDELPKLTTDLMRSRI